MKQGKEERLKIDLSMYVCVCVFVFLPSVLTALVRVRNRVNSTISSARGIMRNFIKVGRDDAQRGERADGNTVLTGIN